MTDFERKEKYTIEDFRRLMEVLRSPEGCVWDAAQTHESIRNNVLEEAYEVAGAIDSGDKENLKEELGDLLMQVIFHARIEEEKGSFDLDDVADGACKKLVFRHPHVFGDVKADDPEAALLAWDEAKRREKHQDSAARAMADVAESLPALWRAAKIQKKAVGAGLENGTLDSALDGVGSAAHMLAEGDCDREETVGRLLFMAVMAARLLDVDPENALHHCCDAAIDGYARAERDAAEK